MPTGLSAESHGRASRLTLTRRTTNHPAPLRHREIRTRHRVRRALADSIHSRRREAEASARCVQRGERGVRGQRHQEAAQEDAQAQEAEASPASQAQAEALSRRANPRGSARPTPASQITNSVSSGCGAETGRPSSLPIQRFSKLWRRRNARGGRRRIPIRRSAASIFSLSGSIIRPRRR